MSRAFVRLPELLHRAPASVETNRPRDLRVASIVPNRYPRRGHPQAGDDFRGGLDARVRSPGGDEAGLQRAHPHPEPGLAHGPARSGHGGHLRHRVGKDPGVFAPRDDPHQRSGLARVGVVYVPCVGRRRVLTHEDRWSSYTD